MTIAEAPLDILPVPGSFIGDRVVTDGSGGEFEHVYAATGKVTKRVPLAGPREVEEAVRLARELLPAWRAVRPKDRRRMFLRMADLLRQESQALGRLTIVDASVPKSFADIGGVQGAEIFEYQAGWIDRIPGELRSTTELTHSYTRAEPYGVIAAMTPFNAPVYTAAMILAPAFAAGNCVVMKPSELSPYSLLRMGELFLEAGFPPGVVAMLPGPPQTGDALVRSPGVDKVFFMGSTKSARYVMIAAAESGPKPVSLELGGKSPVIIFEDADLDTAVPLSVLGGLGLGGQGCILGTRLLVQSSIYDEFVSRAAQMESFIPIGDPVLDTTVVGPVVNERACERILGVIDGAVRDGQGTLLFGGSRLGGDYANGSFVKPTIITDVSNSAPIAREEIFGPVLVIVRFDDEDDAVRLANDSPYGLGAYVYSNDARRVHRMADKLEAGVVFINGLPTEGGMPPTLPFGGTKQSGFGRMGGIEVIREFTRSKTVMMFLDSAIGHGTG